MDYSTRSREHNIERKKKVQLQRIALCVLIVLTVIILSIIFGSKFAYADASEPQMVSQKYFKSITIQPGDTLSSIAENYMSTEYKNAAQYINEVKRMNSMLDDEIQTGDNLIIPYYGYAIEVAMNDM